MPSTSQVSLASQNGPIEATIRFCCSGDAAGQQHADPEVVAVEHDVGEDRDAHERGEDERQVKVHRHVSCTPMVSLDVPGSSGFSAPLPARCVSTTMYEISISE